MKRLFSYFLAVSIGWGAITQPARAFAPVAVLAAPQIVSAGGISYALGAVAGVIGVTGLYLSIKDAQDNAVRIPLGANQDNQPPAPAAAPAQTPQPGYVYQSSLYPGQNFSTASGVCTARVQQLQSINGGCPNNYTFVVTGVSPIGSDSCSFHSYCQANETGSHIWEGDETPVVSKVSTTVCPPGYSGVGCTLTNPRQATNDKTCDILLSNGQFSTADDMNCGSSADGTKLAPMIRDGKVIAYGQTSTGQPLMWEVTPGPQTFTVRQYEQVNTPTQTQVKTTTVSVDASTSAITGVQTQTSPGSISSPTAATAPTVTTQADPTTATNTPTVTQDQTKPADLQTCGLPGSPACNVNDDGFEARDNFSSPKSQEIADKLDQNRTQLENIRDSVPTIAANWIPSLMPGNATACAPLVFDFSVNSPVIGFLSAPNVKLDICEHLELVRSILGYMLGLYTVWYVWRRFTTSNQGA